MKERSIGVADDRMVEREFYYSYIDLCLASYFGGRRANEVLILPSMILHMSFRPAEAPTLTSHIGAAI